MGRQKKKIDVILSDACHLCHDEKKAIKKSNLQNNFNIINMYDKKWKLTKSGKAYLEKHNLSSRSIKGTPTYFLADQKTKLEGARGGRLLKDMVRKNKKIIKDRNKKPIKKSSASKSNLNNKKRVKPNPSKKRIKPKKKVKKNGRK